MKTTILSKNVIAMFVLGTLSLGFEAHAQTPIADAPATAVVVGNDTILADRNGITAYTFDPDQADQSVCYNHCAQEWPPILVQPNEVVKAPYGTTTRKDRSLQLTYDHKPLYNYDDDKKPKDTFGDGKGGVWHIVILSEQE